MPLKSINIMHTLNRSRFIVIVCYLIAASLSLSPVAHASLAMFDVPLDESAQTGDHPCHQDSTDKVTTASHQHHTKNLGTDNIECEHGTSCKIICSVTASVVPHQNIAGLTIDKSSRWLSLDTVALYSSFLSRLDKPPRL